MSRSLSQTGSCTTCLVESIVDSCNAKVISKESLRLPRILNKLVWLERCNNDEDKSDEIPLRGIL